MTNSSGIQVSNLNKSFGKNHILKDISLDIKSGERVVIIGPSGTGKSTLLRTLNFLDRPESGTIQIGDLKIDAARATQTHILSLRRKTAFVFQNYALFANKTALQNITEALITVKKISKSDAKDRAMKILRETGLEDKANSYPSALSGGQQQRVGIGRAMALDSELMLFDEPTSALDPEWVGEVLDLMRNLAGRRQTMLIVTHEMQFAREIADRIVFMDEGRIIEQAPPEELLKNPQDPRTKEFLKRVI